MRELATVFADNSSSTPLDPEVIKSIVAASFTSGNPSAVMNYFGEASQKIAAVSRSTIGNLIGCDERDLVFTGGATESNNLAILGCGSGAVVGTHFICTAADHDSVILPTRHLATKGFNCTILNVDPNGCVSAEEVDRAIQPTTVFVSVIFGNNEVGSINPISDIGTVCRRRGAIFHTDATQIIGKVPVDVSSLPIDLLTFSAHKVYGPKGIGALYVNPKTMSKRINPIMFGGSQERGLRPGTVAPPLIAGFAKACELCLRLMSADSERIVRMRNRLWERIENEIPDVVLNGHPTSRLYNILNVSFLGVPSEAFIIKLRDVVAVSAGSACTSANPEPSHVLRAMGIHGDRLESAIRIGLGRFNTMEEIEYVADHVRDAVLELRRHFG